MTTVLISRMISMSLRRIGTLRRGMLVLSRGNDFGGAQQLGADGQAGGLGRVEVDAQSEMVALVDKANHDAAVGGAIDVTHGERTAVLQARDDFVEVAGFRAADKKDVAGLDVVEPRIAPDDQRSRADFFALHGLVEVM